MIWSQKHAHAELFQWGDEILRELIAEVEASRALIDLTAKNFLELQPGIAWEGGIDAAMKAIVAEVKRLRSAVETWEQANSDLIAGLKAGAKEVIVKDARIKELSDLNEALMENGNDLRTRCQKAEARIKELQDLIDKPPEEADWVADYHLLQSALDGPIIDVARKWHAAYRKAQNSNLMRTKEVERLEAAFLRSNAAMRYYQEGNRGPWPQLGEKFKEPYQEKAREALERIKEG